MNYILIFSSLGGCDHGGLISAGLDYSAACGSRAAKGVGEEQEPECVAREVAEEWRISRSGESTDPCR